MKEEGHLEIYEGLRKEIGMKTYLHGLMDHVKTPKLRFCTRNLDLPESRERYTSSREEEEDAQMCPCGRAVEIRADIVGECDIYK